MSSNAKLKELKNELFNLRFQHAINQLDNPHKIVGRQEGHRSRNDRFFKRRMRKLRKENKS